MNNKILLVIFTLITFLYGFNREDSNDNLKPSLPAGTYDIYYTFTVPSDVLSIIQSAMDEVSPRQYINSDSVPEFNLLLPDPDNTLPDSMFLTYADSLPIPVQYFPNGRINIHWGS